jgi:hypothetical protein
MNVKYTPIKFVNFVILNFDMKFIQNDGNTSTDIKEYFSNYDLAVDYDVIKEGALVKNVISARINQIENPLPGYSLFAESSCIFEFDKKKYMEKRSRDKFVGLSSLHIALPFLRGYIGAITASAPYGKYILPLIDIDNLIEQKKMALMAIEQEKQQPALQNSNSNE